jgi:hypothetical protein
MMESTCIGAKLISCKLAADKSNAGSALVEFAMILPLLIFFFFASFEFSRVLRMHQLVATTAREIARDAYRQCFGEKHFSNSQETTEMSDACKEDVFTQTCLEGVIEDARTIRNAALQLEAPFVGGLNVVLTAFQYRGLSLPSGATGDSAVRVGYAPGYLAKTKAQQKAEFNDADFAFSRFSEDYVNTGEHHQELLDFIKSNGDQSAAQPNGYAIVAEVQGIYDLTHFNLLPHLEVSFDPLGGRYYYVVLH